MIHYYHQGFILIALFCVGTTHAAQFITGSPKITPQIAKAPIPPMLDAAGSPVEFSMFVSKATALQIITDKKDDGSVASGASSLTSPSCSPLLSPSAPSPAPSPESSPNPDKVRENKGAPRFVALSTSAYAGCLAHGNLAEAPAARLKRYTSATGDVYP
ncbi:MAG TPA: hypothetical protein VFF04_01355 [Candidatus Babeliales bacterium]|nr:hypothetical protein [Candidatus Babeliales bacterium]